MKFTKRKSDIAKEIGVSPEHFSKWLNQSKQHPVPSYRKKEVGRIISKYLIAKKKKSTLQKMGL